MTDKQRMDCIYEAPYYTDRDAYISDLAFSSIWGDEDDYDFEIPEHRINEIGNIWDACNRSVKDICRDAGLSQRKLAEKFYIPYRTMENWCTGKRECPIYTKLMMQQILGLYNPQQ